LNLVIGDRSGIKKNIIDKVNAIALKGGSFDEAQGVLRGNVALSKIFRAGDPCTDERGQPVASINNSKIFLEEFMGLGENKTSRIITAESGLYIFTPVLKNLRTEAVPDKDYAAIAANLEQESFRMIMGNLMQKMYEKAKIIKNLKTD